MGGALKAMMPGFQRTKLILAAIVFAAGVGLIFAAVSFPSFLPVTKQLTTGWWKELPLLVENRHPKGALLTASVLSLCSGFVVLHLGLRRFFLRDNKKWNWFGTLCLVSVLVAAFGCCLIGRRAEENIYWLSKSPSVEPTMRIATDPISAGHQLGVLLRNYSCDMQGCYPPQIEQLIREAMVPADDFYALYWREWNPGQVESWLYNGTITDSSPREWPLFVSPEFERGSRIVVFNDISVKKLSGDEFRSWISKWKTTSKEYNTEWSKEIRDLLNSP